MWIIISIGLGAQSSPKLMFIEIEWKTWKRGGTAMNGNW